MNGQPISNFIQALITTSNAIEVNVANNAPLKVEIDDHTPVWMNGNVTISNQVLRFEPATLYTAFENNTDITGTGTFAQVLCGDFDKVEYYVTNHSNNPIYISLLIQPMDYAPFFVDPNYENIRLHAEDTKIIISEHRAHSVCLSYDTLSEMAIVHSYISAR